MKFKISAASLFVAVGVCSLSHAPNATAGDSEKWQALFATTPPPPAHPAEALARIAVRRAEGKLGIDVSDPALHAFQREVDALFRGPADESAAIIERNMKAFNDDPQAAEMVKRLERSLGASANSNTPPTWEQMKAFDAEMTKTFGADLTRVPPPANRIAAYRLELLRNPPRAGRAGPRLSERRHRYAELHAELDRAALARASNVRAPNVANAAREIAAIARDLVAQHHMLARQQLDDANTLFAEARAAIAPAFERMAGLALEAERRNASAGERVPAYAMLKSYIEQLLTIDRVAIEDAGFWAGVTAQSAERITAMEETTNKRGVALPEPRKSLYVFAQAADIDMLVNGEPVIRGVPYPRGREFRPAPPPGIR